MPKMKDSGIEWIGQVPESWSVVPIRSVFEEVTKKNSDGAVTQALKFTYGEIIPKDNFDAESDDYVATTITNYTVVEPNTIMLNGLNLNYDFVSQRIGLVKEKGVITSAYMAFRPKDNRVNSEFATYMFKAYDGCKALHNMGGGVRKILNFNEFKRYYFPFPNPKEQKAIVSVLDRKCSEIDSLRANIETEIETLEEYKKSVITEAVTKGLDKNVPMKDSGIEWIEIIPATWNVTRLKYLATSLRKGNGITKEDVDEHGDIACVRYGEIYSKYDNQFTQSISKTIREKIPSKQYISRGDILFAGTGELVEEIGKNIVYLGEEDCLAGGDIIVLSHNQNSAFLNYVLNSQYVQGQKSSGKAKLKVVHISAADIGNLYISVPDIEEQQRIADYLDEACLLINNTIEEKKEQLTILADYKKSLIYEYVTGKKEVPNE